MTTVTIVYHSGYGHTAAQANAVLRGVSSVADVEARLLPVADVESHWDLLDRSDAIVFGSPTYMGNVSGPFKSFMDATGGRWMKMAWKDKIAGGFTNSGGLSGDKFNTLAQLSTFAAQHGMVWISLGVATTGQTENDANRLGASIGAMAQSNHGAAEPAAGDLKTAELYGERIARAALRWSAKS
jgi:multimeric flavodoxin WrbA